MSSGGDRYFKGKAARREILGVKVDKATATLPAISTTSLFTISGGRILLTSLVGELTIAHTGGEAYNMKIQANPTTGSTADLCADLNASADEVGCLYGITGAFGDALIGTNAGATVILSHPVVVDIGVIQLECGETATTGSAKWTATYIPWDDGAEMRAS